MLNEKAMQWIVSGNSQILAVHAALVEAPGGTGLILYFSGDEHDKGQHDSGNIDHSRLYDCTTGAISNPGSPPGTDLFCCGHAFLADGRLLTAGGTNDFPTGAGLHHAHFPGVRDAWSFDPVTGTWTQVASMNPEPGLTTGGGRWYPTLVTLPNGQVLALGGHPMADDSRHDNYSPEVYSSLWNSWNFAGPNDPAQAIPNYPRLHVLPGGEVFSATPLADGRNKRFNPASGTWTDICARPADNLYWEFATASVLLPLHPGDGYRPRVLFCGGPEAILLDLAAGAPAWTPTAPRTLNAPSPPVRRNLNAVLLPTGEVLVCGGISAIGNSDDASRVLEAELYNPYTNAWTTLPPAAVTRNYHSSALLMPDGRVWTAGGNINAQQSFPIPGVDNRELRIEIFEPWYYGRPDRPQLTASPHAMHAMQAFPVRSGTGENISRVVLVRAGSATHAFNSDQRHVELSFSSRGGNLLQVQAPPDLTIAPPGNYLLFLINAAGLPSVGKFVNLRLTPALLVSRVGDFDGDGVSEILVSSPWGIGILKRTGDTMTPLMMAPNGTRFDGWLLNTADNTFGQVADYDGDGRDEVLVTSPWGIGLLKMAGGTLAAPMMQPNGTRFGGWLLNTADNVFGPAADYDGDRLAEVLVTSPWGIGILKLAGNTLDAPMMQPNGTRFDGWLLNTADNDFGPAADYDGDGRAEILVKSPWGIGLLKQSGATMTAPMMQPNGTRFRGWLLNTGDNHFGPAGDYDGDGQAELLVTSPWGIGILKYAGPTLSAPMMAPNGTRFGGWLLNTNDNDFGPSADYDGDGSAELFIRSPWGIGILKLSGGTLNAPMMAPNGTRFGGWLLNTNDNRFGAVGKYGGGTLVNLFVTSPWGVGILELSGGTLNAPMMQPNGTRFGGWLLNTADNVL